MSITICCLLQSFIIVYVDAIARIWDSSGCAHVRSVHGCTLNGLASFASAAESISCHCRGLLTGVQSGNVFCCPPVSYVAVHDTSPPHGQIVTTDPSSLLIKSLKARKSGQQIRKKQIAVDKGKRPADGQPEGQQGSKKRGVAEDASTSRQGAVTYSKIQLENKTVKDIQKILQEMGLPVSGKKEVLVQRVLQNQQH